MTKQTSGISKRPEPPQFVGKSNKTQFKPGNKLGGRKPGSVSLTDAIRRVMERDYTHTDPISGMKDTKQVRDWIGIALAGKAMKGDVAAIREMLERLEGKVTDKVELTGKDGAALEINHTAQLEHVYNGMKDVFDVEAKAIEE